LASASSTSDKAALIADDALGNESPASVDLTVRDVKPILDDDFVPVNRVPLTEAQQATINPNQTKVQNALDAVGSAAGFAVEEGKKLAFPSAPRNGTEFLKSTLTNIALVAATAGASAIATPLALAPLGVLVSRAISEMKDEC
jgi:hypothetical protein